MEKGPCGRRDHVLQFAAALADHRRDILTKNHLDAAAAGCLAELTRLGPAIHPDSWIVALTLILSPANLRHPRSRDAPVLYGQHRLLGSR